MLMLYNKDTIIYVICIALTLSGLIGHKFNKFSSYKEEPILQEESEIKLNKDIKGVFSKLPDPKPDDNDNDDKDKKNKKGEDKDKNIFDTIKQYLRDARDFVKRILGVGNKGNHSGYRQAGQVVETGNISELPLANRFERDYGATLHYGGDETANTEERERLLETINKWLDDNESYLREIIVEFGKLWKQKKAGEVTSVANGGVLDKLFTCLFEAFKEFLCEGCSIKTLRAFDEVINGVLSNGLKGVSYHEVISKIDFETADAIISSIAEFLQYCLNKGFNSQLAAIIVRNFTSALQQYIEYCRSVKNYNINLVDFINNVGMSTGFSKFLLVTHVSGWIVAAGITVFTLYCYFTSS